MPETSFLVQSDEPRYQVPTLTADSPVGIIVVGESQAGKTTALGIIKNVLTEIHPEGLAPPAFPLSNGLRGMTAKMLELNGVDVSSEFNDEEALRRMLECFVGHVAVNEDRYARCIYDYYAYPRPEGVLRNKAVNSVIATVSEDPYIHPLVFNVAGKFLQSTMSDRKTAPRALVIDGRNREELVGLLHEGGLSLGGLVIMTCGAEDSVRRRMLIKHPNASEKEILAEIASQEARNKSDRDRDKEVGPTTLPEDIPNVFRLHNFNPGEIPHCRVSELLYLVGIMMSRPFRSAVHIATDNNGISQDKERQYLQPIVHGMVSGAQLRA